MKQAKLLALMITLTVLCGCSRSEKYEEAFSSWRQNCLSINEHEIEAVVTASDDKKICEYTILYNLNKDGETVEVLAPEMIAKVKAHVDEKDEARLSYDGVVLDTGSVLSKNLSPLMALPVFMDIVKEGHIENAWKEKKDDSEYIAADMEMPDGTIMTLWLSADEMAPAYAEVRNRDRVEIKIDIKNFK